MDMDMNTGTEIVPSTISGAILTMVMSMSIARSSSMACGGKVHVHVDGKWHLQAFHVAQLEHNRRLLPLPNLPNQILLRLLLTCLGASLLVISLEFLRRLQRQFDTYLRAKNTFLSERGYAVPKEMEEKLLQQEEEVGSNEGKGGGSRRKGMSVKVVWEQSARGTIHMLRFGASYCIMLLFMCSNGYIIISSLAGSLVGFALFTRYALYSRGDLFVDERDKACC